MAAVRVLVAVADIVALAVVVAFLVAAAIALGTAAGVGDPVAVSTRLAQGEQLRWASHRVLVRDGEWRAGGTGVEDALWGWVIAVSDLELHPASVSTGQKGKRTYRMRLVDCRLCRHRRANFPGIGVN